MAVEDTARQVVRDLRGGYWALAGFDATALKLFAQDVIALADELYASEAGYFADFEYYTRNVLSRFPTHLRAAGPDVPVSS